MKKAKKVVVWLCIIGIFLICLPMLTNFTMVKGLKGDKGDSPIKGVDYWTAADQLAIKKDSFNFIAEQLAKRGQLKPEFANSVKECTDTTKLYVLPDGYLYAYMVRYPQAVVSEKVGLWYGDNGVAKFYISSTRNAVSKETDYIPVIEGDELQITVNGSTGWEVNGEWYDEDKNPLSVIKIRDSANNSCTSIVTAPENAKYVRIFSHRYMGTGESADNFDFTNVPLSVEWITCNDPDLEKGFFNTGIKFIASESADLDVSPLKNKKIVYDGDSICSSWGISVNGGSYPQIIADTVGGTFVNEGVGGGRFVTAEDSGDSYHSIVDNLVNLPTDGDLYCFEGGVNDHWQNSPLGEYSLTDYTSELDESTFCGAFESVLRYAVNNFVGKPICVIIPHKCLTNLTFVNDNGNTFEDFREKMIGLCEKYSIPYYDAYTESGLNAWNDNHLENYFVVSETTGTGDGVHPNAEGYKRYYVPQLIKLFESMMPIQS